MITLHYYECLFIADNPIFCIFTDRSKCVTDMSNRMQKAVLIPSTALRCFTNMESDIVANGKHARASCLLLLP